MAMNVATWSTYERHCTAGRCIISVDWKEEYSARCSSHRDQHNFLRRSQIRKIRSGN